MIDLFCKNQFECYIDYISNYSVYMKRQMEIESIKYFVEGNRLKVLAQIKLDCFIATVDDALNKTVDSLCQGKKSIKTFFFRK